ncbi:MAG: DNA-binding response regulator [Pedosphaera sp.]|nr:DNA-binding response regulator [Pedosphaera sp.]
MQKLPARKPELILMDLNLPQMPGTECIRRLKELLPATRFIVLTVHKDSEHIFRALKAGASGQPIIRILREFSVDTASARRCRNTIGNFILRWGLIEFGAESVRRFPESSVNLLSKVGAHDRT